MNKFIEMLKKLLSIKDGGMEFLRLVVKLSVWIFVLGAFFYGLVWIPNQMLNIQISKANLEVKKVQRGCEVATQRLLDGAKIEAQKAKRKVTKEQEIDFYITNYNLCVYTEAMEFLSLKPQVQAPQPKQQASAPVKTQTQTKKVTEEKVKKEEKK